jgi:hypothetical protein
MTQEIKIKPDKDGNYYVTLYGIKYHLVIEEKEQKKTTKKEK